MNPQPQLLSSLLTDKQMQLARQLTPESQALIMQELSDFAGYLLQKHMNESAPEQTNVHNTEPKPLWGVGKGNYIIKDNFDDPCPEIEEMFGV